MTPRRYDRRANAGCDNIGVGALQRRRRVVDDHARVALSVLRRSGILLSSATPAGGARSPRRRAATSGHNVDGDGRRVGLANGQGLHQALRLRIHAKQPREPGFLKLASTRRGGTAIWAKTEPDWRRNRSHQPAMRADDGEGFFPCHSPVASADRTSGTLPRRC